MFLSAASAGPRHRDPLARMPERFRGRACARHGRTPIAAGSRSIRFSKGPVVDGDGNLYVTDIPFGRIFRISPSLEWEFVAEYDGEPNGMKRLDDEHSRRHRLPQWADARAHRERQGQPAARAAQYGAFQGRQRPGLRFAGQSVFHRPGPDRECTIRPGRVYRLAPDGKLDTLIANAPSPNGVVLSPDEHFLYVAMTRGNCVWRMPLFPDGSIGKAGQFFTSYGPSGPDGLAMDEIGAPHRLQSRPGLGVGAERTRRARGNPAQRGGRVGDQRRVRWTAAQDRLLHGVGDRQHPARADVRAGLRHACRKRRNAMTTTCLLCHCMLVCIAAARGPRTPRWPPIPKSRSASSWASPPEVLPTSLRGWSRKS